jgi:hypothetical protein
MTRASGERCAYDVGAFHEDANRRRDGQTVEEERMDSYNNSRGRSLATKEGRCADLCEDALKKEELTIITK